MVASFTQVFGGEQLQCAESTNNGNKHGTNANEDRRHELVGSGIRIDRAQERRHEEAKGDVENTDQSGEQRRAACDQVTDAKQSEVLIVKGALSAHLHILLQVSFRSHSGRL
jgi:hypothetical protein